jgi:hypothetical protein
MDIVAAFPNATRQYWIDVTVRSPHADRYNTSAVRNATNTVGYAASDGAKEKWQKYKSQLVIPISYEPYGRLAAESLRCLEHMAISGATVDAQRWAGSQLLTRWLRVYQRMVIWASTDVALASIGRGATKTEAAIAHGNLARRNANPIAVAANLPSRSQTSTESQRDAPRRGTDFPTEHRAGMQFRSTALVVR